MKHLFFLIIFTSTALLARSQQEKPSKLEVLSGIKPQQESPSGFLSLDAETDIDAGAEDRFCLRLSGQVSDMKEEDLLAIGALPGFRTPFSRNFVLELEAGAGLFLVQSKLKPDKATDSGESRNHPEVAPSVQGFGRLAYKREFYGEGYFIHAFYDNKAIQHVRAELGYLHRRWNPFLSFDTLYSFAGGARYEVGKNAFRLNPGLGIAWSGNEVGGIFSVTRLF